VTYHVFRKADAQADASMSKFAQFRALFKALVSSRNDLVMSPKDSESRAHQLVCQMLAVLQYIELYPTVYKRTIGNQLHHEGAAGEQAYLTELVAANSMSREQNQYAMMPGASPELQAEVLALLRDDKDYDFVSKARRIVPKPEADGEADGGKIAFQPPVVGGAHTDADAEAYLKQFRQAIPEDHELGMPAPGKKRRVVFLKFWRNVADTPILNHHLAVLDKTSLEDADICAGEFNFKGMIITQHRMKANVDVDKLRWVYFPRMHRDEILCFQQGDLTMHNAEGQLSVTFPPLRQDHATFHGAFVDPTAPSNAPPRQSLETAAFVFLPEEPINNEF